MKWLGFSDEFFLCRGWEGDSDSDGDGETEGETEGDGDGEGEVEDDGEGGVMTVALSTGLRLRLWLMDVELGCISISNWVVVLLWISKAIIMSILFEGTLRADSVPSLKIAFASWTWRRIFE